MADEQDKPSKPRRRWFQFSLRTLLLLIVVCAGASYYLRGMVRQWKYPVRGVVFLDGKPVTDGFGRVTFELIDAETGQPSTASGRVQRNGSYVLTTAPSHLDGGIAAGSYRVAVTIGHEPAIGIHGSDGSDGRTWMSTMIPEKYTDAATSGLAFTIPDDLTHGRLDLHLSSSGK